jgi:ABC-2 type transport system ATP-binding protein
MTLSPNSIIETKNLTKKYGNFVAVDKLNLSIPEGEIFGLLGPNGAGKTTIILMLLGLTEPTSGYSRVCGFDPLKDPFKVKRLCGYLPERLGFYENLTAGQNLRYIARLNKIPEDFASTRIDNTLIDVDLADHKNTKVKKFSRGMKQRLGIANVLFKDPRLMFLDEPTQGIDPKGIRELLDLLKTINKKKGITIILLSHLMFHVQQICDNIGIMGNGKLIKHGKVKGMYNEFEQKWIIEIESFNITENILKTISEIPEVIKVETNGNIIIAECESDLRSKISSSIINEGGSLLGLRLIEHSLEDIYQKYSEDN